MNLITSECTCVSWDDEANEWLEAPECWGDCHEGDTEQFAEATTELFTNNTQGFRITGFPVWNGTVDGVFTAKDSGDLLRAITPNNGPWRLTYEVVENELRCVLSHHDAPTGGRMTVKPCEDAE